jgi:putative ABC transport system permease protein
MTTTVDMKSRNVAANVTRELLLPPLDPNQGGGLGVGVLVRESLDSLLANKGRALLTMLGVIIGVASVVALMALGNGASREITGQVQSIGTNLIFVMPSAPSSNMQLRGQAMMQGTTPQTLTVDDARAIEGLGLPLNGVASVFNGSGEMVAPAASVFAQISGTNASYFTLNELSAAQGVVFTEAQDRSGEPVVVLGANLARDLFGDGQAVGETLRVKDTILRVIGVLAVKGGGGFGSVDDQAFVPISLAQTRLFSARTPDGNSYRVASILLSAQNANDIRAIQDRITVLLRERHRLDQNGGEDDFRIFNQESFVSILNNITGLLTTFLAAIAAISLVVGGIGIMNIMLVSVTERTREIGLRKAVGARAHDILMQFIVEALVISLLGGLIGLAFGMGVAFIIGALGILAPVISATSVMMALGFSMAVGLFFGIYPARRAARLNPIDALRYE